MGFLNPERFIELMQDKKVQGNLRTEIQAAINGGQGALWMHRNDRETLMRCYNQIKDYIIDHGWVNGKRLRPWFIDPQWDAGLDRNEVWWGMEFETGYKSFLDRSTAIDHVWENYHGTCFDSEGEGAAAVEITFSPCEQSKFQDGTAPADSFMRWLSANRVLTQKTAADAIGTHINISAPGLTPDNNTKIHKAMTFTLARIPREIKGVGNVRQFMFGRANLYGGWHGHNNGTASWLEGKLFRTTYDYEQFRRYVKTCNAFSTALVKIIEFYTKKHEKGSIEESHFLMEHVPFVTNMYEVAFDDADPIMGYNAQTEPAGIQGEYGLDTYKTKTPQTLKAMEDLVKEKREAAERERIKKENQAIIEAAIKQMVVDHKKIFAAKGWPNNIPKEGWTYCEDCELWHDDDGNNWFDLHPEDALKTKKDPKVVA